MLTMIQKKVQNVSLSILLISEDKSLQKFKILTRSEFLNTNQPKTLSNLASKYVKPSMMQPQPQHFQFVNRILHIQL